MKKVLAILDMLVVGLLAGSMLAAGIELAIEPGSAATYAEHHQWMVRSFNRLLPVLGMSALVLTSLLAVSCRGHARTVRALAFAAVLLLAAGLITALVNQPLNEVVVSWGAAPPPDWSALRDRWGVWQWLRFASALCAQCLLLATLLRDSGAKGERAWE